MTELMTVAAGVYEPEASEWKKKASVFDFNLSLAGSTSSTEVLVNILPYQTSSMFPPQVRDQPDVTLAPGLGWFVAEIFEEGGERTLSAKEFLPSAYLGQCEKDTAHDCIDGIKHALETGAFSLARGLSHEGARFYPDNRELQKYARVLAPPRLVHSDLPPNPAVKANREWLKKYAADYQGRWVGLRHGELIAVANSYETLVEQCGETTGVLLTKV